MVRRKYGCKINKKTLSASTPTPSTSSSSSMPALVPSTMLAWPYPAARFTPDDEYHIRGVVRRRIMRYRMTDEEREALMSTTRGMMRPSSRHYCPTDQNCNHMFVDKYEGGRLWACVSFSEIPKYNFGNCNERRESEYARLQLAGDQEKSNVLKEVVCLYSDSTNVWNQKGKGGTELTGSSARNHIRHPEYLVSLLLRSEDTEQRELFYSKNLWLGWIAFSPTKKNETQHGATRAGTTILASHLTWVYFRNHETWE